MIKRRRHLVQAGFLALTLIGVFALQGHAERWCPFGGVEAAYGYITEGNMLCSLGVSNFYILGAVLLITLILRRAFCGYVCPIGALSEWLGMLSARLGIKPARVPAAADRALGLLKYAVLAIVLFITWRASELHFRAFDPCYALISRHGEDITYWAYVVAGGIVIGSLLVTMPFCRWLCPLAAVFHPLSRFGFARIKRDADACTGCRRCTRVCPMAIPVHEMREVKEARCITCLNCVDACPELATGAISWGPPDRVARRWPGFVPIPLVIGILMVAVVGVYAFPVPSFVRTRGDLPDQTAVIDMKVDDLTCRGRATLLTERYLWRTDDLAIPGYMLIEAWPGMGFVQVRVTYDPAQTDAEAVKMAITEPYFDIEINEWLDSPFTIEGYDPFQLLE